MISSRTALTLLVGISVGGVLFLGIHLHNERYSRLRCAEKYPHLNEHSVCLDKPVIKKTSYVETREKIEKMIADGKKSGALSDVSVSFRDLQQGPVFGISELMDFVPASLLKLPLSIVYLSAAEKQRELLGVKIKYSGTSSVAEQRILPQASAQQGVEYEMDDLLHMMLSYSDNASYETLEAFLENAPERKILRLHTLQELGFVNPEDKTVRTLTVRSYAGLFNLLYNATFLNAEYSEKVLSWLIESPYKNALAAGVPTDVRIAHKFGERTLKDGTKELHDCGIIYFPENPYLLCVMTRGTDFTQLEHVIAEISRIMYEEVNSRRL